MNEGQTQQSGTPLPSPQPGKTPRELLQEAQQEQRRVVTRKRIELLDALEELKAIGGQDDTKNDLLEIVRAHPNGILLPIVQQVIPDASALVQYRKALEADGKIQQIRDGQTWLLKPAE